MRTNNGFMLLHLQGMEGRRNLLSCSQQKMLSNTHKMDATGNGNRYYCDGRAECASINCKVNGVFEQFQVNVEFLLPFSTVLRNGRDSFMRSELDFSIDEYPYDISKGPGPTYKSMVTTEFLYRRKPAPKEVAWWIIAIAIATGLICLLILIVAMWKCGFFKRKKIPKTVDEADDVEIDDKTEVEVLHDLPVG